MFLPENRHGIGKGLQEWGETLTPALRRADMEENNIKARTKLTRT